MSAIGRIHLPTMYHGEYTAPQLCDVDFILKHEEERIHERECVESVLSADKAKRVLLFSKQMRYLLLEETEALLSFDYFEDSEEKTKTVAHGRSFNLQNTNAWTIVNCVMISWKQISPYHPLQAHWPRKSFWGRVSSNTQRDSIYSNKEIPSATCYRIFAAQLLLSTFLSHEIESMWGLECSSASTSSYIMAASKRKQQTRIR